MKRLSRIAAVLAISPLLTVASLSSAGSATAAGTLPDYSALGPYAVTVAAGDAAHTNYYPTDLGPAGTKHAVIVWGNGTGASVSTYDTFLRHMASWGFVVAAANTTQSGSGVEMLDGARWLISQSANPASVFYGHIDAANIGASGHSQGGGGALVAGANALIKTTAPISPGPQGDETTLRGPVFFAAAQLDWIVPSVWVKYRYGRVAQVPAVFGEVGQTDHFYDQYYGYNDAGATVLAGVTAWFRYQLMGDAVACTAFFGASPALAGNPKWSDFARNSKANAVTC
jgi:hypothetical protein